MDKEVTGRNNFLEKGQTFNSFCDLEKQLSVYQDINFVQLYKRSSRTIHGCQKIQHLKKKYNPDLKYAVLDYTCIHGGKNFKSTSTGLRQNTRTYQIDCPMSIKVRTTTDGQNLVIADINEKHNHDLSKELYQKLPRQRQHDRMARITAEAMLQLKMKGGSPPGNIQLSTGVKTENPAYFSVTEETGNSSDIYSKDKYSGTPSKTMKSRKRKPIMKQSPEPSSDCDAPEKEKKRPCIVTAPPLPYRRKNYLIRHYDHEVISSGTKMVSLLKNSPPDDSKGTEKVKRPKTRNKTDLSLIDCTSTHPVLPVKTESSSTSVSPSVMPSTSNMSVIPEVQSLPDTPASVARNPSSNVSSQSYQDPANQKPLCIPSSLTCYPIRLEPGQEIKSELQKFVEKYNLKAAFVMSCVGSVSMATLRMADSKTIKRYSSDHEILSLVGTLSDGGHLHISLGDENGDVIGGHVVGDLLVNTTAEIMIGDCSSALFTRKYDPNTGYKELEVLNR